LLTSKFISSEIEHRTNWFKKKREKKGGEKKKKKEGKKKKGGRIISTIDNERLSTSGTTYCIYTSIQITNLRSIKLLQYRKSINSVAYRA